MLKIYNKLLENNKIDMIIDYLPISSDKKELKVKIDKLEKILGEHGWLNEEN